MRLRRIRVPLAAALLLAGTVSRADDPPEPPERPAPPRWSAGAAVVFVQSPYLGQRGRFWAFPSVGYRGSRFYILGPGLGVRLAQAGPARLDAVAQVRFSPFNEKDGGRLDGVRSRPTTVEAGPRISAFLPPGLRVEVHLAADVLGRHNGVEAGASVARPISLGAWTVTPSVRLAYWTAGLTDHYFGVRAVEQAPGRPVYRPGATWTPSAELAVRRRIGDHWAAIAGAGVTWLGPEVTDSPLVARAHMTRAIVALTRAFP